MITIKDLLSVIENDVLQTLFVQRYELISSLSIEDKEKLQSYYDKCKIDVVILCT